MTTTTTIVDTSAHYNTHLAQQLSSRRPLQPTTCPRVIETPGVIGVKFIITPIASSFVRHRFPLVHDPGPHDGVSVCYFNTYIYIYIYIRIRILVRFTDVAVASIAIPLTVTTLPFKLDLSTLPEIIRS
jgi:hypothetical protein